MSKRKAPQGENPNKDIAAILVGECTHGDLEFVGVLKHEDKHDLVNIFTEQNNAVKILRCFKLPFAPNYHT